MDTLVDETDAAHIQNQWGVPEYLWDFMTAGGLLLATKDRGEITHSWPDRGAWMFQVAPRYSARILRLRLMTDQQITVRSGTSRQEAADNLLRALSEQKVRVSQGPGQPSKILTFPKFREGWTAAPTGLRQVAPVGP